MTEPKYLGKKPPEVNCTCFEEWEPECHHGETDQSDHYREALLETADDLMLWKCKDKDCTYWAQILAKKLRTSAGVE